MREKRDTHTYTRTHTCTDMQVKVSIQTHMLTSKWIGRNGNCFLPQHSTILVWVYSWYHEMLSKTEASSTQRQITQSSCLYWDSSEYLYTKLHTWMYSFHLAPGWVNLSWIKQCAYQAWPLSSAESPPPTCSGSLWPGPEASSHCSPHALSLLLSPPNTGPMWDHQRFINGQTVC